ncbi:MAG: 50S ribosomal protein L29 [Patescibacteria group bacterium]|jgi:large subunit ribosomal protein L29
MKFKELKTKSDKELQKLLAEWREKSRELRFKVSSEQLKNVREVRKVKKTLAQIMFLLSQKNRSGVKTNK